MSRGEGAEMLEVLAILIAIPMVVLVATMLLYILGPILSIPVILYEAVVHRRGRGYDDRLHPA